MKDSSPDLMSWPTMQVMAFLLGRSLYVYDDTNPDAEPKLLSPTPIYDFMTRGEFPQPQQGYIHERIMKASYKHIASDFESLRGFKSQSNRDLLIPARHQLVHDIKVNMKDAQMTEDGVDKDSLIAMARSAGCIEECRSIAEMAGSTIFEAFDKSCDRMEFNWIQKMITKFGLSEFINISPLSHGKLHEIATKPLKGIAVIGSRYVLPDNMMTSIGATNLVPIKVVTPEKYFRNPSVDPLKGHVAKFMADKNAPEGWKKN